MSLPLWRRKAKDAVVNARKVINATCEDVPHVNLIIFSPLAYVVDAKINLSIFNDML